MADDHAVALGAHRPSRGPLIRPERYPFFDKLIFAVFVLAVPVFVASHWTVFRDGDVSWHVAAGRWIVENGRVPSTDPFSMLMLAVPLLVLLMASELVARLIDRRRGLRGTDEWDDDVASPL